ncbi:phytoene desaturase family protein [Cytobacillus sp. FJAT-54145]|uniref:Phytoene desaturase family protein n=1 Tax=Cytobacillus spartinae TaxID=3299023 RepID=A0ABW6K8X1_9BACI
MLKLVCIIGAGIGGLTAGAYLAKSGYRVTVLEKATTVGGSAGWYIRNKRMFPTGATIAFGLEENGLLKTLLDELQIELTAKDLLHPMDVILPDRKISICKDPTLWENELRKAFSDRAEDVVRFWNELVYIGEGVLGVTKSGVSLPVTRVYELGNLPKFIMRKPNTVLRLARYARWTVEDLMKKFNLVSYTPLRQFLNAQLIDAVQTDVSEAALLPSSLALTVYRNGSYAPQNGMGQISKLLAERINELGGEVLLASPVQKISYDDKEKVWNVYSKKCSTSFDIVINNSGISLGPNTSYADSRNFSWGAFRIDTILSDQIRKGPLEGIALPYAYQIVPDNEATLRNIHGPVYVTFHETIDQNGEKISGEITMTVSVHTNIEEWLGYSRDDYKDIKNEITDMIISVIEKVIPIRKYLLYMEAGSPSTYKKFIGKAEVGGFPLTVKNAIIKPKGVRSSLPQFYIVGEQVFPGPGTLSSALSGYYAARAVIKG